MIVYLYPKNAQKKNSSVFQPLFINLMNLQKKRPIKWEVSKKTCSTHLGMISIFMFYTSYEIVEQFHQSIISKDGCPCFQQQPPLKKSCMLSTEEHNIRWKNIKIAWYFDFTSSSAKSARTPQCNFRTFPIQ